MIIAAILIYIMWNPFKFPFLVFISHWIPVDCECLSHVDISLWISKCWWLESCQISIWRFPKTGVPPVIIHFNGIFLDKPSSYGGTPISKDPHISMWPQHPFGTSSGVRMTALRVTIATIAGKTSCSAARWARGPWGGQRVTRRTFVGWWDDNGNFRGI